MVNFNLLSKLYSFFKSKSVEKSEADVSEVTKRVTTLSDDIQFESVKKVDEFLSQLQGRYNL